MAGSTALKPDETEIAFKSTEVLLAVLATVVGILTLRMSVLLWRMKTRGRNHQDVYELHGNPA